MNRREIKRMVPAKKKFLLAAAAGAAIIIFAVVKLVFTFAGL
ncbi:hypothetical protein [Nitrososphaera sp.]